jgi:hypothetical protein
MRKKWFVIAPFAIAAMIAFLFIGGKVVEWLWNWLMPMLFGLRQVTFWQALGLLALSRILFGGGITRGFRRSRWTSRMTDEERDAMRNRLRERLL